MILSNVIVDITIPRRSFVFGQSRAKVSAGFTNVRSLAVTAFDLVYCSLSVFRRTDREQYTRSNAFSVEQLTLTLKMATAQVIETPVTVNNNSAIQDYLHPDDQTHPTLDIFYL